MTVLIPSRYSRRLARRAMARREVLAWVAVRSWTPLSLRFRRMRKEVIASTFATVTMTQTPPGREPGLRFESHVERFARSFFVREVPGPSPVAPRSSMVFASTTQMLPMLSLRTLEREKPQAWITVLREHRLSRIPAGAVAPPADQVRASVARLAERTRTVGGAQQGPLFESRTILRTQLPNAGSARVQVASEINPMRRISPQRAHLGWMRSRSRAASVPDTPRGVSSPGRQAPSTKALAAVPTFWRSRDSAESSPSEMHSSASRVERHPQLLSSPATSKSKAPLTPAPHQLAWKLDGPAVDRLAEDIMSRIERRTRIERQKRGL